eukprot:scaffold22595_cov63-Phaeocystis_antarctica.AAC.11
MHSHSPALADCACGLTSIATFWPAPPPPIVAPPPPPPVVEQVPTTAPGTAGILAASDLEGPGMCHLVPHWQLKAALVWAPRTAGAGHTRATEVVSAAVIAAFDRVEPRRVAHVLQSDFGCSGAAARRTRHRPFRRDPCALAGDPSGVTLGLHVTRRFALVCRCAP